MLDLTLEAEVYTGQSVRCTYSEGPQQITRWFVSEPDDALRKLLDWHNPKITRKQLLAACYNRWPCGYWYEIADPLLGAM